MYSIAFICTGNTCRSPMAQALAEQEWEALAASAGVELRMFSAGLAAVRGQTASPHAISVVSAHGGDLSGHRSRPVSDLSVEDVDLFVTMTTAHRDALRGLYPGRSGDILTLGELAGVDADVDDPFGGSREDYARNHEQLSGLIAAAAVALRERLSRAPEESSAAKGGGHHPEKGPSRA